MGWCTWNNRQRIGKGIRGLGNKMTSGYHPEKSTFNISQNTEKSPGDVRTLAVSQTPQRNHHLMLVWKTLKGVNNNFNNNQNTRNIGNLRVSGILEAGHCWKRRDELISDVLLWTPTYGRAKAGWPARTFIQQLCEDTGCSPEDPPEAMNVRKKWREKVRDVRAGGTTWWWWWSQENKRTSRNQILR